MAALNELVQVLQDGPEAVAGHVLEELQPEEQGQSIRLFNDAAEVAEAEDSKGGDSDTVVEEGSGVKTSDTAAEVLQRLGRLLQRINSFVSHTEQERERRAASVALLSAAARAGLLSEGTHVSVALQAMLRQTGPLNALVTEVVDQLTTFHEHVVEFPPNFGGAATDYAERSQQLLAAHAVSRLDTLTMEMRGVFTMQLRTLMQNVLELLRHFSHVKGLMDAERAAISAAQDEVMVPLQERIEKAEESAQRDGGTTAAGRLQAAVEMLSNLLSTGGGSGGAPGGAGRGGGGGGVATGTMYQRDLLADSTGELGVPGTADANAAERAATQPAVSAELQAAIGAATDAENDAMRRQLHNDAGARAGRDAEAAKKAQLEARRKEVQERQDLTEAERARLLRELDEEQATLAAVMGSERRRQQAELDRRLAKRKRDALNRKVLQAEAKAAAQLADKSQEALAMLAAQQRAEREAAQAQLQKEYEDSLAQLAPSSSEEAPVSGDAAQTSVERQLAALRAQHEAELEGFGASMDMERRRQKAALEERLRLRAARRRRELELRQQQELAAAQASANAGGGAAAAEAVAALRREQEVERAQLDTRMMVEAQSELDALQEGLDDAQFDVDKQRAACIEEYEKQVAALAANLSSEQARQRAELQRRLAQRQEQRAAELRRKQAREAAKAAEAAKQVTEAGGDGAAAAAAVTKALAGETEEAMARRHAAENKALEAELVAAAQAEARAQEIRERVDRSALQAEAQMQEVRKEHEAEAARLRQQLATERRRQRAELEGKLLSRRAAREERARRQQASAMEAAAEEGAEAADLAAGDAERDQVDMEASMAEEAAREQRILATQLQAADAQVAGTVVGWLGVVLTFMCTLSFFV